MSGISFGLYLGNTSACLAIYKDENVDAVANHAGDRVTAAVVAFHNSEKIIGAAAKAGLFRNGPVTVMNNKRLMNKETDNDEIELAIKNSLCKLMNESENEFIYSIKVNDKLVKYTPKDVSTLLFKEMYDISNNAAHDDNEHNVVLCVPTRFNNESIKSWSDAAKNAQFKVLQTIAEPIATCLAHGLGKDKKTSELILVYRVGGVSSDISLVNITGGAFTLISNDYYQNLGGEKLTELLSDYLSNEFRNKYKLDPNESKRSVSKLKNEAEKCKHILSTMSTAHCFIESLCEGVDFSYNITRARFENLIGSIISDYIQPIMSLLNKSSTNIMDIKKIILCGGTMKIPKLQEKISSIFPNGEILTSRWNPDETMAIGAAIHSAHLINHGLYDKQLNSTTVDIYSLQKSINIKFDDYPPIVIPEGSIAPIKILTNIHIKQIHNHLIPINIYEAENNSNEVYKKIGLISYKTNGDGNLKVDTDLTETSLNINITEVDSGKKSSFRFPIHEDDA